MMNNNNLALKKRIFYPFTIIVVIMIIILTISLYTTYINRTYSIMYDNIDDSLEDSGYSIYHMTTTISNVISQLSINSRVKNMMYSTGNHTALDLYNCQKNLSSYALSSSVVSSIYIYNKNLGGFLTSYPNLGLVQENSFFDDDIILRLNDIDNIKKLTPIPREIDMQIDPFHDIRTQSLLSYVYYESLVDDMINEAIIININQSYMTGLLDEMNEGSANNKYIIDNTGEFVLTNTSSQKTEILTQTIINTNILSSENEKGYFELNSDGDRYHISFQKLDIPKWILINETPIKSITKDFQDILVNSILISTILLILAVILTTVLAKYLYKPIEKVVYNLKTLQNEQIKNAFEIKQNYLRKLIKNGTDVQLDKKELTLHDVFISFNEPICIMLIQYDQYNEYLKKTSCKKRHDDVIKTVQIVSETLNSNYCADVFYTKDDMLAALINVPTAFGAKVLLPDCRLLKTLLNRTFQRSFTITIGPTADDTSDINYYYLEAIKASRLRLVKGIGKIFEYNELRDYDEHDSDTTLPYHKKIVESLLCGKINKASMYHNQLIQYLKATSPVSVTFSHIRLAFFVYESVYHLLNDAQLDEFSLNRTLTFINNAETVDELKVFFDKWFSSIYSIRENVNKNRHKDLVDNIKVYVTHNFSDANLSQSIIADKFNISNAYLGRLFRQLTNQSIAAYINDFRLKEARQMLIDTKISISDIAVRVGIINSNYLYSLFKKRFGITPSMFRKQRKHYADRE